MMLDYDNDGRRLLASERAERLMEEMRRSRRLTPDAAGYRTRITPRQLLRRFAAHERSKKPESAIPAYDA